MFHGKSAAETLEELRGGESGLGDEEAALRLAEHGPNEIGKGAKRPLLDLFLGQFRNYLLILLIAAAMVAQVIGHYADALAIGIVVLLNVVFGVALEYGADRSMEELHRLAETKALVLRAGRKELVDAALLVPGDVIFLEEGGKVPADARILESQNLEMNEASLTGEPMPAEKNAEKVAAGTALAERSCMVYAGTFVARGAAKAVVVATGLNTEIGKIAKATGEEKKERPTLEIALEKLGKMMTIASLAIVGLLFVLGLGFGKWAVQDLFIYSVSVIVAAVPEGMLTILTLTLALGVMNMAKENAIVRKLQAVETLGNITFIATDKTGTITEGRMALVKVFDGKLRSFAELGGNEKLLSYSYLCNSAHLTEEGVVGDETDRAFLIAGIVKGVNVRRFKELAKQVNFEPFDSVKKTMGGIYEIEKKKVAIVKGAPENVLRMCTHFEGNGKLDGKKRKEIEENMRSLANQGMRIIGIAYGKPGKRIPEKGLTFLGLLALNDPVRGEVAQTMAVCRQAGIRVMMITGDSVATAQKIAHSIGLGKEKGVAAWSELEKMNDGELGAALRNLNAVARATPASKLRIVEMLVKQGEIVAVTGDGVNDAPALKKAHVGVVMGRTGTAVSKEVADLVLMDDNFATLEKAIEYGRGIADNITRFLRFQITTSIALVMLSIPFVIGIEMLQPVQILWINLIIDGPPALTLGLEKPGKEVMARKPRKKSGFIDRDFLLDAFNMAFYMAVVSAAVFFTYRNVQPGKAITMAFSTFALMQVFNALNSRSSTGHFYSGLLGNRWLVISLIAVVALQIAIVSLQPLQALFGTVELGQNDFIVIFVAGASVLVVGEAKKLFLKRAKA